MVVLIGLGSSLAGEYNADYDTPGSESEAASDLTEREFEGYSGQEVYVVWEAEAGADSPEIEARVQDFLVEAKGIEPIPDETGIRISEDGTIGATTLPLTIPGWEVEKEDGEKLVAAPEANPGGGLGSPLGWA